MFQVSWHTLSVFGTQIPDSAIFEGGGAARQAQGLARAMSLGARIAPEAHNTPRGVKVKRLSAEEAAAVIQAQNELQNEVDGQAYEAQLRLQAY